MLQVTMFPISISFPELTLSTTAVRLVFGAVDEVSSALDEEMLVLLMLFETMPRAELMLETSHRWMDMSSSRKAWQFEGCVWGEQIEVPFGSLLHLPKSSKHLVCRVLLRNIQ